MGLKIRPLRKMILLFQHYFISLLLFLSTIFAKSIFFESSQTLIISFVGMIIILVLAKLNNLKKSIKNLNAITDFFLLTINLMTISSLFSDLDKEEVQSINKYGSLLEILCGNGLFLRSYHYKVSGIFSVIALSISLIIKLDINDYSIGFALISIFLIICVMTIKREYIQQNKKCCEICQLYSNDLFFIINSYSKISSSNYNFQNFLKENKISETKFFKNLLQVQIDIKKEYLYQPDIKEIISDLSREAEEKNVQIFGEYLISFQNRKEKKLFCLGKFEFFENKNEIVYIWKKKRSIYVKIKQDKCLNETLNLKMIIKNYTKAIYYIAHELRNPLSCVLNMELMDSINKDSFESLKTEYIQPAVISSKLMLNLVNGLLDIGQIEAGTFRLAIIDFDLKSLIEEIFNLMKFQARNRGLEMELDVDPHIKHIKSDPNRIRQIIINLMSTLIFLYEQFIKIMLGNAMKYTTNGKIILKAEKITPFQMKISVKDTGLGIEERNLANLFQAFSKVQNLEDSCLNSQGVGLGLLISNKLANLLNKSEEGISVSSKYKYGSEFSFKFYNMTNDDEIIFSSRKIVSKLKLNHCKLILSTKEKHNLKQNLELKSQNSFPFKLSTLGESFESDLKEKPIERKVSYDSILNNNTDNYSLLKNRIDKIRLKIKAQGCNCPTALIIDDDDFNILSMKTHLKKFEISCETAVSGQKGIDEIFKMHKNKCCKFFKYIFLDLEMPEKNGIIIYEEISEFYKRQVKVDSMIILNTGYSISSDIVKKAVARGIKHILIKPINQMNIVNLLDPL